jgi:hypothetical protein
MSNYTFDDYVAQLRRMDPSRARHSMMQNLILFQHRPDMLTSAIGRFRGPLGWLFLE